MSPLDHNYWVYALASALHNIAYAETLPEAKKIAKDHLRQISSFETGLTDADDETRQRWQIAGFEREEVV